MIRDFGPVQPFANIRDAEARHIQALLDIAKHYAVTMPENPWAGKVSRYATVREACQDAVAAEIENGRLYARLLESTDRPDMLAVFRNLRDASEKRHLLAFRRCLNRRR